MKEANDITERDDSDHGPEAAEEGRSHCNTISTEMRTNPSFGWKAGGAAAACLCVFASVAIILAVMKQPNEIKCDTEAFSDWDNQTAAASVPLASANISTGRNSKREQQSLGSVQVDLTNLLVEPNTTTIPIPIEDSQCYEGGDGTFLMSIEEEDPPHPVVDYITPSFMGSTLGGDDPFNRTFDVVPNHTILDNNQGVIFNVETVPEPLPEHLHKPRLSQEEVLEAVQHEAGKYYLEPGEYAEPPWPTADVEVLSETSQDMVFAGGQGFLAACMMAFANHLPLALSPDHLWAVISSGFAYHVNQHAEELRHRFVNHTGQLQIEIQEDTMVLGQSPPAQWETLIFPKFAEQIRNHLNSTEVYDLLVERTFSTTTPTTHAASRITLMSALRAYFTYSMRTSCGIPQIQLEGSLDDWISLRDRAEALAPWMMSNHTHGDLWIQDVVLPILDQFIEAYEGNVQPCFWQSMVKFRNTADRSGAYDFLSGWLPNLFPYLTLGNGQIQSNRFLRHWSLSAKGDQIGPNPDWIPSQLSSAPVVWKYYDEEFDLHFHAGFRGVTQEAGNGMIRPQLGWYVTHDPR